MPANITAEFSLSVSATSLFIKRNNKIKQSLKKKIDVLEKSSLLRILQGVFDLNKKLKYIITGKLHRILIVLYVSDCYIHLIVTVTPVPGI